MKLNTYTRALAACLSGTKKVDCAYIMYTTKDSAPEITDFSNIPLDDSNGLARTKSIILSDVSDTITFTLTSHNAENIGGAALTTGANVYGIALVVSDEHREKDIPMYYYPLESMVKVTANSDIAVNVTINMG